MTAEEIAEKFKRSQFWREGMRFRTTDVASFCKVSTRDATYAVRRLDVTKDGQNRYRKRTTCDLAHTVWRKPLPFDGECTPKWY